MTHGTLRSYWGGCRCEDCTQANRDYMREYTVRRRGGDLIEVDRDALSDLLAELFPLGLTEDCPAARRKVGVG